MGNRESSRRSRRRSSNRLEHNYRIWSIIRLVVAIKDVYESLSFYDLDKNRKEYLITYEKLKNEIGIFDKEEIDIAIRYCKIKRAQDECDYDISQEVESLFYDWESFQIDWTGIFHFVKETFKHYWDGILANYKRPSARSKRIAYLINHLSEIKTKGWIIQSKGYVDEIDNLIEHYKSLE